MIKIATIVPKAHLNLIEADNIFMVISSMVRADKECKAFFRDKVDSGKFVILDSPVVEDGAPESVDDILALAMEFGVSEVISPDYFQDPKATIAELQKLTVLAKRLGYTGQIMVSPQGATREEWNDCAKELLLFNPKVTVGISYRYCEMFGGSRYLAVSHIQSISPYTQIHLLGAHHPIEVHNLSGIRQVRSVDSAIPCVYAKHNIMMSGDMPPRPPRDVDYIKDEYPNKLLEYNIRWWQFKCDYGDNYGA